MRRAPLLILALAVGVRAALLASPMVPREWVMTGAQIEVDKVAASLATTGRYADPYAIPTGPTAHPLPIHTGLQALIDLVFGMTPAAAWARSLAGILACGCAFAVLPWFARRLGLGAAAGIAAGTVGAVIPLLGVDDVLGWLWNESMTAVALALLAVAFLSRWQAASPPPPGRSFLLGVGAGAAFHLAPTLLPVVLGFAAFEAWWLRGGRRWAGLAVIACGILVACVPWEWRLYRTFDELFFIRSNFGLELRIGNHDGARADVWATDVRAMHPGNNVEEARRVASLGEARYMATLRDAARAWIASHPSEFARLTASRAYHVWFGPPARPFQALPVAALTLMALAGLARTLPRLGPPARAAVVIPLAAFPLVYYVVGYVPRYTYPLVGVLLVLAASAVVTPAGAARRASAKTGPEVSHATPH